MVKNTNDRIILGLKADITSEKEQLRVIKAQRPITNCSLEANGVRYNLHAINRETTIQLLVWINAQKISAVDLGLLDEYKICNYHADDWIKDLKSRLLTITTSEREAKLKSLEAKLHQLLSVEKRVELEIDLLKKEFNS